MQQSVTKPTLIFYIHGWSSSGLAIKANLLKNYFSEKNVYSPTLPVNGELAIHLLEQNIQLLQPFYNITLVGSSLGGFYSIYLSEKYNLKAVLINPAVDPFVTMKKYIGEHTNFDQSKYTLNQGQVDLYKKFEVEEIKNQKNFLLLLQKGDELLNYNDALKKLPDANIDLEEGGSHVYEGFERKFDKIKQFIQIQ